MIKKPKAKARKKILDYFECADFIAQKLGIKDLCNVAGKTYGTGKPSDDYEYQDFWHQICDGVHNGCEIGMLQVEEDQSWPEEEWVRKIAQAFNDEFGEDAIYWVEW